MLKTIARNKEYIIVGVIGFIIFALLNLMMLQMNYDRWTDTHWGAYTAFNRGFELSGFDQHTYIVVSEWRPLYELYRHPLLAFMIWPLSEINSYLKDWLDINCAIYVVAAVWTIISTCTWTLLYKIIRILVGLCWQQSLLLTFFFYGFSHVMLASFAPDHMILTLCVLLVTIYVIGKSIKMGKVVSWWKVCLFYMLGTGISTTNCVKIWLMDMAGLYSTEGFLRKNIELLFRRSVLYIIPTIIIGGLYFWQLDNTQRQEQEHQEDIVQTRLKKDSVFRKNVEERQKVDRVRFKKLIDNQLTDSKFMQWTDNSVDRWPLIYENIFGEGLILHEDHLLQDANARKNTRPVIVPYTHWWVYGVEGVIVVLFALGLWCGRRQKLLYLCLLPMLFDAVLHIGLRFAASDVYIMTAHWAFIIPVSVAYLMKMLNSRNSLQSFRIAAYVLCFLIGFITLFLWYHNVSLIASHILNF